jgi:hypothetical protein
MYYSYIIYIYMPNDLHVHRWAECPMMVWNSVGNARPTSRPALAFFSTAEEELHHHYN